MLFLAAVLLITMGAGAQLKQSSLAQMPVAQMKEMKMGTPGMPAQPRLNANRDAKPYYIRPAGAFYATIGYDTDAPTYYYLTTNPYLVCKPYTYYTFKSVGDGVSPNATYTWFNSSEILSPLGTDEILQSVMKPQSKPINIMYRY